MRVNTKLSSLLTITGGSSSIRFAVYEAGGALRRQLDGKIDRIGVSGTNLVVTDPAGTPRVSPRLGAAGHRTAVGVLLDWLEAQPIFVSVTAVGHRVVHGMTHSAPEKVTPKLIAELHRITPYAPDHLPREIGLIEAFRTRYPKLPQVACFDTAFHRTIPRVATLLPIHAKNAPLISRDAGRVKVRVIRTDEELMIARSVTRVLTLGSIRER